MLQNSTQSIQYTSPRPFLHKCMRGEKCLSCDDKSEFFSRIDITSLKIHISIFWITFHFRSVAKNSFTQSSNCQYFYLKLLLGYGPPLYCSTLAAQTNMKRTSFFVAKHAPLYTISLQTLLSSGSIFCQNQLKAAAATAVSQNPVSKAAVNKKRARKLCMKDIIK